MRRSSLLSYAVVAVCAVACDRAPEERLRPVAQIAPVRPRRVAFSPPDGQRLMVMDASGTVGIWNITAPGQPTLFASLPARAVDAAYSPDGRFVATVGMDGRVRYWGADGHLEWVSKGGHTGIARSIIVTSEYIASGGEDGTIRFWHLDGTPFGEPLAAHAGAVVSLAVSARGDLASLGTEDAVRLWTQAQGAKREEPPRQPTLLGQSVKPPDTSEQILRLFRFDLKWGWDRSLAFSPSGDTLAAVLFDRSLRTWNIDGTARAVVPAAHSKLPTRALSFVPRADEFVTVGFDGNLRRWRIDGSPAAAALHVHNGAAYFVAFSPDGKRLATTGSDDLLQIWNSDGTLSFTFPPGDPGPIRWVALAPQAPLLASADDNGDARLWNLDGTARGTTLRRIGKGPATVTFAINTELLATGGWDGTIRFWNFSAAPLGAPMTVGSPIAALAFSPVGSPLAVGTALFQVWNNGAPPWKQTMKGADYVQAIGFSPRGDLIVTGGWLGTMQLWTIDGSRRAERPKLDWELVQAVAFAPDGKTIAAAIGEMDTVVRLFDLDLQAQGPPLEGLSGQVPTLAFAPDGRLVTGGADGIVRWWTLPSRQVESLEVGRPINQLGYWHDLLWVRCSEPPLFQDARPQGGRIIFYDARHAEVATMIVRPDAALIFTTDGWFSATDWPSDGLRLYRQSGEALSDAEMERRRSPERVLTALKTAAAPSH